MFEMFLASLFHLLVDDITANLFTSYIILYKRTPRINYEIEYVNTYVNN